MVSVTEVINRQYPHWLYARIAGGANAVQDEQTGQWQGEQSGWAKICRCREETNGRGNQIQTAGGEYISYSAIVQLPQGAQAIDAGTEIIVSDFEWQPEEAFANPDFMTAATLNGSFRIKGICLKFDAGRLHSRLWL